MPLSPTTRLGPYEVVATLGAGGMGEVYRARDTRLARDVAVKVLPASLARDAERQRRFEQEALAIARLNHPSILQVYDVGHHEGQPFLVTELLEGETLRDRLGNGPLPVRKAIELAVPIAGALGVAHEQGIVHRDLKPENLFITAEGRAKILDFGLAKLTRPDDSDPSFTSARTMENETGPGVVMGTAGYMSPEQVRGHKVDHRSDIFSFGAILYEMLSGRRAFHGESPADTMSAILREDPPDFATLGLEIPPVLQLIVSHCLEKSPGGRFRSAHDLAFQLEAISGSSSGGLAALAAEPVAPRRPAVRYRPITHRRGVVYGARFAPDGETILYGAAWEGQPAHVSMWRPESPEAIALPLPSANLLAVSRHGETALCLDPVWAHLGTWSGTLATAQMFGGAPRPIEERVHSADFAPVGPGLVVIRDVAGRGLLEFPVGNVLCETTGHFSYARFSPSGDLIAFLDHPLPSDDRGAVAIVDRNGDKRTLTDVFSTVQGLAWSPSGDEILFTANESEVSGRRSLYAVRRSGEQRFVSGFPGSVRLMDVSRDGRLLMTRDDDRVGVIGKPPGDADERDLSWLDWSVPCDLSKDGKIVLFDEDRVSPNYVVCLRQTDGAPVVRLGEGAGRALSHDRRWVLAALPAAGAPLRLLPTGAGRERVIPVGDLDVVFARWLSDNRRIFCLARPPDKTTRAYLLDAESGVFQPLAVERAERSRNGAITADDELAAMAFPDGTCLLIPLGGGGVADGPALEPGEEVIAFSADGAWMFVEKSGVHSCRVQRVHVESGRREPWKELSPRDASGVILVFRARLALDGEAYVYGYFRMLSDLYVAEGLG